MLNVSLNDIPIIEREDELWTIKFFSTTAQSSSFTAHHFHVMIGLNVYDEDDGPCKHCTHTTQELIERRKT